MAIEIERKFLVNTDSFKQYEVLVTEEITQGYLTVDQQRSVRVRHSVVQNQHANATSGYITIKGGSIGSSREEYEYAIPPSDALKMLNLCTNCLEKTRWHVRIHGATWHIDEFSGKNAGLRIAEIELKTEDEYFQKPIWLDKEVTHDKRYSNANLAVNAWSHW